jgi:acyl-coenzyme A thioesterase PaaI-like protein
MNWTDTIALTRLGDRRFQAHVDDQWTSLQGVHGGVVAAIAVKASSTVLRDAGGDTNAQLRAATFGYVSGNTVGDLTIDIEIIRRGRAMSTTHARVTQGDKTTTVARFHHSTPWEGLEDDELIVRDDGKGFRVTERSEAVRAGHIGLESSRERVEAMDGEFRLDTKRGAGTQVRTLLPVSKLKQVRLAGPATPATGDA